MSQNHAFPRLREQAIALRRAGRSRREIAALLGITSNKLLNEAVRGEPPQPWTWRPNAKDALRGRARDLRAQGLDYRRIAAELGVSKSSVSLWVRDMPRPERLGYEECRARSAEGVRRYWAAERPLREAERAAARAAAATEIGALSDREVLIAGAIAYWCEGTKDKPHRRADRVDFINSDPALIRFFLRFLALAGVAQEELIFRIYVHEDADVAAAHRFWLDVTRAHPEQFRRPVLKRHNPRTLRKNTGGHYRGCLRVSVRRSIGLYWKIESWAAAIMAGPDDPDSLGEAGVTGVLPTGAKEPGQIVTSPGQDADPPS